MRIALRRCWKHIRLFKQSSIIYNLFQFYISYSKYCSNEQVYLSEASINKGHKLKMYYRKAVHLAEPGTGILERLNKLCEIVSCYLRRTREPKFDQIEVILVRCPIESAGYNIIGSSVFDILAGTNITLTYIRYYVSILCLIYIYIVVI